MKKFSFDLLGKGSVIITAENEREARKQVKGEVILKTWAVRN